MFSLDNFDFQFDKEIEPFLAESPAKSSTVADIFREPSRLEINVNKGDSVITKAPNAERAKTKAVRRKFPGPAGLLPDKPPTSFNDSSLVVENVENDPDLRRGEPIFCSQASVSIFNEPQFKKLAADFELEKKDSSLSAFTIDWVKKKALGKGLKSRKIPFLAVILQSVDCSSVDPLVTLRDPTGDLFGALHREAWKDMANQLQPGVAIVLKEVGVLSTGVTRRQVILNITKNNILSIYSANENGQVITNTIQPTTKPEILRNVADWKARAAQIPAPNPALGIKDSLFVQHPATTSNLHNRSKPLRPHLIHHPQIESSFDLLSDDIDFSSIHDEQTHTPKKPKADEKCNKNMSYKPDTQIILSQAETSMLDEVLSGVDLDDF